MKDGALTYLEELQKEARNNDFLVLFSSAQLPMDKKHFGITFHEVAKVIKTNHLETMIMTLLDFLEDELSNYNYTQDYSYFETLYPFLEILLGKHQHRGEVVLTKLDEIEKRLVSLLHEKPGNIKKNHPNYQRLKQSLKAINHLHLFFLSEDDDTYFDNKYQVVNYLFFKKKRLPDIERALKLMPTLVNLKDKQGNTLLDQVIDHYFASLESYALKRTVSELEEAIYYSNLTSFLLFHSQLSQKKYISEKGRQLKKLKDFIDTLEHKHYPKDVEEIAFTMLDELFEMLTAKKEIKYTYDELANRYHIKERFPSKVEREARQTISKIKVLPTKSQKVILTIDGEGAQEIDDGLSCERRDDGNYLVGVHIANPLGYLQLFGPTLKEASERGTTIYLGNKTVPMIPPILSKKVISLTEKEPKLARSFYFEVSSKGEVNPLFTMKTETIEVYRNLTYKEANDILKKGANPDPKLTTTLGLLQEVSTKIDRQIKLPNREAAFAFEDTLPLDIDSPCQLESEKVVETFMLLLNRMTASYCLTEGYPYIYRNHVVSLEEQKKLARFKESLKSDTGAWQKTISYLENTLPPAYYDIKNKGHWALGYDTYSHVSSPLRRYADILAGFSLDLYMQEEVHDQKIYELEKILTKSCKRLNSRLRLTKEFTSQIESRKTF